jgi:hypothetical protein
MQNLGSAPRDRLWVPEMLSWQSDLGFRGARLRRRLLPDRVAYGRSVAGLSLTVRYEGAPEMAGFVAQVLRDEGLVVGYNPPVEQRGMGDVAPVVVLFVVGSTAAGRHCCIEPWRGDFGLGHRARRLARDPICPVQVAATCAVG